MVQYQLPMGLRGAAHRMRGDRTNKALGNAESTLTGIREKTFTKIEIHAGMEERLVKDLAIEEALQNKIKEALEHINQSYVNWCALSY